jgi:predicted secreted Zn-dependent protease
VPWGRKAARAIDQAIAALPEAPSCTALEHGANALGRRLLAEHVAGEREYDRSISYGATKGAQLGN